MTKETIRKARKRYRRGVALYNDGDYRAALAEFHRSNKLRTHGLTIYNIATCYSRLGEYVEAIEHYRRALRARPRLPWRKRRLVRREIARLRSLLAIVKISLNVPKATLILNGREYRVTNGHQLKLPAGIHTLAVKAPGYSTRRRQVTLAGGTVSTLSFQLAPATRLRIRSRVAGARVLINGDEVGETPYAGDVQPGPLRIRVQRAGHLPWQKTIKGRAGQTVRVNVRMDDPSKGLGQHWFWSTAGTAFALGVTSLALGLKASGYQRDYDSVVKRIQTGEYENAEELRDLQERGRALQTDVQRLTLSTNVCLGITAAATAAAVTLAFFTRFHKPMSRAKILLSPMPAGGAALVARGRFP